MSSPTPDGTPDQAGHEVDAAAVIAQITEQRNQALDQLALARALIGQLRAQPDPAADTTP